MVADEERVDAHNGATPPVSTPSARSQRMLEGAPLPLLARLAAPNAIAFFVQASVSMAEVGFVGRLGAAPLAALALMFPALMLMQMLANGAMGGAVSSALARALGAGECDRARALVWHALVIAVAAGVGFFVIYTLLGQRLLNVLDAPAAVIEGAHAYGTLIFGGSVILWITALSSAVYRGMGNMRFPAALMIVGAGVQVPLAGTLILGWFGVPRLGLQGAAVAVLVISAVNAVVLLWRLAHGGDDVRLEKGAFRLRRAAFAAILRLGALASLSPLFVVLTIVLVNGIVSGFGVAALAGYGIVARLEFLLIPMVFGLGAAMTAVVGVNIGAGRAARAERIAWIGGGLAAALTGVVGVALAVAPGLWVGLFTDDAAVRFAGETYLRIVGPAFAFQGLGLSLYFASQGAGTVSWPVAATVLRFVIGVGGGALAVHWLGWGLEGVYVCLAAAMLVYGSVTAASVYLGTWRRRGNTAPGAW